MFGREYDIVESWLFKPAKGYSEMILITEGSSIYLKFQMNLFSNSREFRIEYRNYLNERSIVLLNRGALSDNYGMCSSNMYTCNFIIIIKNNIYTG